MNERIEKLRELFIVKKIQKGERRGLGDKYFLAKAFEANEISPDERYTLALEYSLGATKPIVYKDEYIASTRTLETLPELYTVSEMEDIKSRFFLHEAGEVCNICVDYTMLMNKGLDRAIEDLKAAKGDERYIALCIRTLRAIQGYADRLRNEAERVGNTVVFKTLSNVPAKAPGTFLEALQFFRLIHFAMWMSRNYHNTVGRFDQYMLPYLEADLEAGRLDKDSAFELVEEFFLTFNRDSELYTGIQQGDNGQSMMLGGINEDGSDSYNILSEMCLKASLELNVIDPKINLRVSKSTPVERYVEGTRLTRRGLGFPQYSNDDVVIPALIKLGYEPKDAYNYTVAACWEFIIPGRAMDIPNIEAVSMAKAVRYASEWLENCDSFDAFLMLVKAHIVSQCHEIEHKVKNLYIFPSPLLSTMMEGCADAGKDISLGCIYNNYGVHGTGFATAADSLAAVKKYVFEDKSISKACLANAVKNDFKGEEKLLHTLRVDAPKLGKGDKSADEFLECLIDMFADALSGKVNERGGIFRAGTGSAMYYLWHADNMGATPDGRRAGESLGANFSPSIFAPVSGPVSVIKSFSPKNIQRAINGGPLTMELHDSVFRNEEALIKTAMLVKGFIDMGGHQLQLNAVNRDRLLDAQAHPENYQNLIVRVWGWSGYFVRLDRSYQDHIIRRAEMVV
ncbi:MAG: pyruvate formate-lyase [Clostridiales bacterium]|nr:pyruvate formate-lyase [Clostridiales bacterium]